MDLGVGEAFRGGTQDKREGAKCALMTTFLDIRGLEAINFETDSLERTC